MSIIKDYKFKDIEKYLKKDSNVGKDIIEAFKHLSDAAIIFAPIILGPKFLILLDLLEVKDKLFDLGHKVYNFIALNCQVKCNDRVNFKYCVNLHYGVE